MLPKRLFEHGAQVSPAEKRLPSFRGALNDALREEMRRDESVFVMGQDVGKAPPFGVTVGLLEEFGEGRVRDTPISEIAMVGSAVGAAMAGMRPIVEIQFGDFLTCAMDQITNQAGLRRYMSGGQLRVPLVVRLPCGGGQATGCHHAQSLYSWFAHFPGLKVVLPSSAKDAKGLMKASIRDDNPVLFFEHKRLYRTRWQVPPEFNSADYVIPLGVAEVKRAGSDITVVASLAMVYFALEAAGELEAEDIDVEVVDPRTLVPLDEDTIINSVNKTGRLVVVDEAYLRCGIQAEVVAVVTEKAFDSLKAPPKRLGNPNVPVPFVPSHEALVVPDKDAIVKAVREVVGRALS